MSPLPMRLLYLIPTLFSFLFQTCVSQWTLPDEIPGWIDLRQCVKNCMTSNCSPCGCPVASAFGCATRICICQQSLRKGALENVNDCVKKACGPGDEPSQAVTLFANWCDNVYSTSVGVSLVTAGTSVTTTSDSPFITQITVQTTGVSTVTKTAHIMAQRGVAQRSVALLWGTLMTLVMSLVAATIWGWVAV